jgi:cobalt-zinc-cadmium efflux system protein
VLNLLFVGIEAGVGVFSHSMSLLSDAGHNLSDVFSLLLVLVAFRLARVHSSHHFTYGLKKSTVLISLLNAILLLVAVGAIYIESIHKLFNTVDVDGVMVSWTAFACIVINGFTALLLMRGGKSDLNVRGAFLHMLADTLVSVGVVVSGVVITYTGWNIVDPLVSIVIATIILWQTWGVLRESIVLSVDGTPAGIDAEDVGYKMSQVAHVTDIHHLHIWAISTTSNALTAHVAIDSLQCMEAVREELKHLLAECGISHCTLEFETADTHCHEDCCG